MLTLEFSENLYPLDHFFQANTTLEKLNEDIERVILIEYFT